MISQAAGSLHLTLLTHRMLAQIHELQGQLRQAVDTCCQALQLATEATQPSGQPVPAAVYVHLGLGDLLREWNELDEADRHLGQGLKMGRQWQIGGDTLRDGYLFQARLKQAQGDMAGAVDSIRQAQELATSVSERSQVRCPHRRLSSTVEADSGGVDPLRFPSPSLRTGATGR